jgi:tight adherence protein B
MTGAALHLAWLILVAALAMAGYGLWLLAKSFGGPSRSVARRLAQARPADAEAKDVEDVDEPLFTWIDNHLPWIARRLDAANVKFTPSQVVLSQIALAAVSLLLLDIAGGPAFAALLLATIFGAAAPLTTLAWLAGRRQRRFVQQMPQAVDLIARSLQAGHPVTTAMSVAAQQMADPFGPELKVVIAEMNFGLDRDTALRNLVRRFPAPELRMFAASLEITRETGGNVSEVLLGLADRLRQQAQLHRKIDALSAEGKLSFWVVAALPVISAGAILALRPQYYHDVAGDPLFWPLMSGPPILLALGAFAIWRMINFRV